MLNFGIYKPRKLGFLWLHFYGWLCSITHVHCCYTLCGVATYNMSITTYSSVAMKPYFFNPENPFMLKAQLLFFNIKVPLMIYWHTSCLKIKTQQITGFILVKQRKRQPKLCVRIKLMWIYSICYVCYSCCKSIHITKINLIYPYMILFFVEKKYSTLCLRFKM